MNKITSLKNIISQNGNKFLGITFIKKDGSERTLNGHIRHVRGHDGANPIKHKEEYITLVLNKQDQGKVQFRNVNLSTVKRLAIGGKEFKF